ncbi:hypothetical protein SEVIR_7G154450v4 [Setaria viridis]|uniref:Uncharacterized protein n=1 Tax=Setaria italica TaxID=4555 RepID=K3YAT0_SETIT
MTPPVRLLGFGLGRVPRLHLPQKSLPSVSGDGDPSGPRLLQVLIRQATNGMLPRERAWRLAHLFSGQDCHASDSSAPVDSLNLTIHFVHVTGLRAFPAPDLSRKPRAYQPVGEHALPPEKKSALDSG